MFKQLIVNIIFWRLRFYPKIDTYEIELKVDNCFVRLKTFTVANGEIVGEGEPSAPKSFCEAVRATKEFVDTMQRESSNIWVRIYPEVSNEGKDYYIYARFITI